MKLLSARPNVASLLKVALIVPITLTIVLALNFTIAGPAHADGGNCGPGWTLSQYINGGCAYSGSRRFYQASGTYLRVNVYIDSSVPSALASDTLIAMGRWTKSNTSVRFFQTSTPCNGLYTDNCVRVTGSGTCSGAWAQGDSGLWLVTLFTCYQSGSQTAWQGVITHEFGHVLGLAHNNYSPALMMPGVLTVFYVQTVDASIETSIYPLPANCQTGC